MKALNIPQPWATLLMLKYRCYHTFAWETPYRGLIAICASDYISVKAKHLFYQNPFIAVFLTAGYEKPEDLPCHVLLGAGCLWDCRRIKNVSKASSVDLLDLKVGHYVWCFENICALHEPKQQKGGEGLWELAEEDEIKELLLGKNKSPMEIGISDLNVSPPEEEFKPLD